MKRFTGTAGVLLLAFILFGVASVSVAQESGRARIAVMPLVPIGDDPRLEPIASTVSGSVRTVLRLLSGYQLVPIPANVDPSRTGAGALVADLARELGVENVVFGTVGAEGRAVEVRLAVYNRAEDRITVDDSAASDSIFDILDETDQLIAAVMEGFTGERLGFGRITLRPDRSLTQYEVLVDGEPFGRNITTIEPVPAGSHAIEVRQSRPFGYESLVSASYEVREDETTAITIPVPEFTVAERMRFTLSRAEELRGFLVTGELAASQGLAILDDFTAWDPAYQRYREELDRLIGSVRRYSSTEEAQPVENGGPPTVPVIDGRVEDWRGIPALPTRESENIIVQTGRAPNGDIYVLVRDPDAGLDERSRVVVRIGNIQIAAHGLGDTLEYGILGTTEISPLPREFVAGDRRYREFKFPAAWLGSLTEAEMSVEVSSASVGRRIAVEPTPLRDYAAVFAVGVQPVRPPVERPVPGTGSASGRFTVESLIRDYYAPDTVTPPVASITVDGDLSDWAAADIVPYRVDSGGQGGDRITEWAMARDDEYLYFRVRYSEPPRPNALRYRTLIMTSRRDLWNGDLELNFSGERDGDPIVFRSDGDEWIRSSSGHGYRVAVNGNDAEYRIRLDFLPVIPTLWIRPYIRDNNIGGTGQSGEIHSGQWTEITVRSSLEDLVRER